jgi:molybdopterin-guanine dinucleotide biosynthesis protein A
MACAASGGRNHPVVGLWPVGLREELRHAMVDEEIRKVDIWTARYKLAVVDWPAEPLDPFFNTNKPEDLETAEQMLARRPA